MNWRTPALIAVSINARELTVLFYGCFENPVVFSVLQRTDHRLSRESMANGVAMGTLFAFLSNGTGALASIAPVGLDLPERSH